MAKRVVDPVSVSQINSILQGVVKRGTASQTVGKLNQSIAGKTGTTNNAKDVWFVGYTPSFVGGCYIGYDSPRSLGVQASGGSLCGNAFKNFVKDAYGQGLLINWKIPKEAKVLNVDYDTGKLMQEENKNTILEIFRKEQLTSQLNYSSAIDGGLGMGEELLYRNELNDDESMRELLLRKSFGAINSGDKY